ncbi:MAG: TPM domain-containing protein [Akkermansiaceae bacterium]
MHSKAKYVPIDDSRVDGLDAPLDDDDLDTNLKHPSGLPDNLSKKELFASQLASDLPRCPECIRILKKRTLDRCDYCGFSFSYLEKLLPLDHLPTLEPVLDFSNRLDKSETERIKDSILFIKKRYPQFIPKVCLLPLQANVEVHQMAIWMVNQCPLADGEKQEDKEWYVLLLIDTSKNKVAITYGYQAEIFIPDEPSRTLVSEINRKLNKDNIGNDIANLLNELVTVLDTSKRMIKRKYKIFKRKN